MHAFKYSRGNIIIHFNVLKYVWYQSVVTILIQTMFQLFSSHISLSDEIGILSNVSLLLIWNLSFIYKGMHKFRGFCPLQQDKSGLPPWKARRNNGMTLAGKVELVVWAVALPQIVFDAWWVSTVLIYLDGAGALQLASPAIDKSSLLRVLVEQHADIDGLYQRVAPPLWCSPSPCGEVSNAS